MFSVKSNSLPYDYAPATEQVEGSGQFANPQNNLDGSLIGPRISAPAGGLATATDPYQFSSTFQITSDNSGNATVYEWSNTGADERFAGGNRFERVSGGHGGLLDMERQWRLDDLGCRFCGQCPQRRQSGGEFWIGGCGANGFS